MSTVVDPVYYACLHDQDAQRAATSGEEIAMQLLGGEEVELDFDQILAKAPHSPGSTTPWHQDAAFWPASEGQAPDAGPSANCWLAVSEVPVEMPSSSPALPMLHTQTKWERAVLLPMSRGDVVVHREHVVHGSGPNVSSQWRASPLIAVEDLAARLIASGLQPNQTVSLAFENN
ncbi:PhyH-domain-containing protein, partial [Haematococcus lacustris]